MSKRARGIGSQKLGAACLRSRGWEQVVGSTLYKEHAVGAGWIRSRHLEVQCTGCRQLEAEGIRSRGWELAVGQLGAAWVPDKRGHHSAPPPRPIHVFILKSFVPRVFCKIVHRYVRPPPRYFSHCVIMLSMNDAVNCQIC